jgi:ABC-type Zn uptake system ZnuABC Zn-binding protein ZnuA
VGIGRWIGIAAIALTALLATACGDGDDGPSEDGRLTVVATTTQIADLARHVGGERAEVDSLLPANADAHDFEPTPRDVEKVADAGLVLEHGLGLDPWAENLVDQSGTDARIVVVTEGVTTMAGAAHDADDAPEENDVDPHVWLDVANARVMVENIRDALVAADPAGRNEYEENATAYLAELTELDEWIGEQIATIPPESRKLVTNHAAFGYYVHAYGLELVGSVIPSLDSQAQPSARETAALIDRIRASGVKAIFTEASLNPDLARQLADEAGVVVVDDLYSDSLGPQGSGAETYTGMMRGNTEKIVAALR